MPIYEYACMECESHFEELVRNAEQAVACPECGAGNVLKQFSTFAVAGVSSQPKLGGGGAAAADRAAAASRPPPDDSGLDERPARRLPGRDARLHPLPARGDTDAGGLRLGRAERRVDVRGRGARLPRGQAGRALRRPGRAAARDAPERDRALAHRRLHRERPQVQAAREPRPAAGRDRGLRVAPLPPDRADPARARGNARQLRHEAALRPADRDHACTGRRSR